MNKNYTKLYLRRIKKLLKEREKNFEAILNSFKSLKFAEYDIFLSHSYKDKKLVEALYLELNSRSYKVYVDWICNTNLDRNLINRETAQVIRENIKKSKCLIYATSDSAKVSRWMPWECGYMDGFSGYVAILPITNRIDDAFKGEEFLSLYPLLKRDFEDNLVLEISSYEYIMFDDWINKSDESIKLSDKKIQSYYYIKTLKEGIKVPLFGIGINNIINNIISFLRR